MRVINYQPSYPTDSQSQSERTQNPIPGAPAHMLPVRTLCPTYDPSECASRPNQVQAMARSETAERLACLVIRCGAAQPSSHSNAAHAGFWKVTRREVEHDEDDYRASSGRSGLFEHAPALRLRSQIDFHDKVDDELAGPSRAADGTARSERVFHSSGRSSTLALDEGGGQGVVGSWAVGVEALSHLCAAGGMLAWWAPRHGGVALPRQ